jgi:hypothetical protein
MAKSAVLVLLLGLPVYADIIKIKNGGQIEGWIKFNDKDGVVIETLTCVATIPHSSIESINTEHESKIEVFYQMWDNFKESKVAEAFCFLVRWCQEHKLDKFVAMVKRALYDVDPGHDCVKAEAKAPGTTELKPDPKPAPGEKIHSPKAPKKPANLKIAIAPTWVPPLAKIGPSGSITYPQNALPGATWAFYDDAFSVPYWGIPPQGLEQQRAAEDLARAKKEFTNDGLMNAIRSWTIVERDRDILLLPPNMGDTRSWRLIWSLAPRTLALAVVQAVRSGKMTTKDQAPAPATSSSKPTTQQQQPAAQSQPQQPPSSQQDVSKLADLIRNKRAYEVTGYLSHNDPAVRRMAVEGLGQMRAIDYAHLVAALVTDSDKNVRRASIWALGEMGATQFAGGVAPMLKDPDANVRQQAAKTLARLGAVDQIQALEEALAAEKVSHVAQSIQEAIKVLKSLNR